MCARQLSYEILERKLLADDVLDLGQLAGSLNESCKARHEIWRVNKYSH